MKIDPAIKRTRDARRGISASVADDPVKIVEYYVRMQERLAARLCRGPGDALELGGELAEHQVAVNPQKDARR
jgi:hypothetical protein